MSIISQNNLFCKFLGTFFVLQFDFFWLCFLGCLLFLIFFIMSGWWKALMSPKKLWLYVCGGVFVVVVVILLILSFKNKKMSVDPICVDAVQEYLKNADMEWQDGQQVKKWDEIVVDYIGRLDDGTVFDTSVETVARACNKYNEARNYDEWLAFTVWAWQMIAGFDRWVEWMNIWQTKSVEIAAADAYGEWDENLVYEVDKADLQNPGQYEEWQTLYTPYGQAVKVTKVTKDKVYIDANHELAWKKLIFDITIKEIK